jgi:hypothetical protein
MDTKEIILVIALLVFVAVRLYLKYFRKDQSMAEKTKSGGRDSFSTLRDDDYEPYSKK